MPRLTKLASLDPAPAQELKPSLSALCSEAAGHVAEARKALFAESLDTEAALAHLDKAIGCLQRLLSHGQSRAA